MPLILGANSVTGGYEVDNSLRFNSGSSDSLTRTNSVDGTSNQIFTMSLWIKKTSNDSAVRRLIELYNTSSFYVSFRFRDDSSSRLDFYSESNGVGVNLRTNRSFRDVSAWYHLMMVVNTTLATADDRMKMYVNGVQETSFALRTNPSLNENLDFNNSGDGQYVGRAVGTETDRMFNGYMSEINFIDGQALAPSDFGEFDDSGIWKPIAYEGTYGTNGFYLEFKDSSALGDDTSNNSNDFTVNNLTSIDQTTDTPTNNFCTLNPLSSTTFPTFSEGNLKTIISTSDDDGAISRGNIFVSQSKWYWEVKLIGYSVLSRVEIGVETADSVANNMGVAGLFGTGKARGRRGDANTIRDGNATVSYGSSLTTNDIVGVALDLDNGAIYFSTNGVWENSGDPESGASKTGAAFTDLANDTWSIALGQANSTYEINTGNAPFTITTGNSDANDYGNFEHEVPSGFYALNTKNLAEYG